MPLAPGSTLGPYTILDKLGEGGMGEVYRARDTQLLRDVAVKILPALFAADPDRLARFEREAQALAALNHPNIAQIYGIDRSGAVRALVMELVEGEDLSQVIARGRMDLHASLAIARQIADALEAAHERGIIHRDLKPANIKIRDDGTVKVLDFGLAKAMDSRAGHGVDAAPANSPTFTSPVMTQVGVLLGTAAYMAPEQARGKAVDARADIWAFGAILYEMLAGRSVFAGENISEVIAAVIKDDVRWTDLPQDLPPSLRRLLRRCLQKDPARRLRAIADARLELEDAAEGAAPPPPVIRARARWPLASAGALAGAVLAAGGMFLAARPALPAHVPVIRAVLPLKDVAASRLIGKDDATMAISPDGRLLAYVNERRTTLTLQDLATGDSRVVDQTGEVGAPFFSPDGRFLAYIAGVGGSIRTAVWGSLEKVPVTGGAATNIVGGITGLKGASWGDDGWIYYSPSPSSGLWRVRADGGAPEQLTVPDAASGEKTHRLPFVLPGSKAVLFVVGTTRITSFDDARIEVLRLEDRSRHRLVEGGTAPRYLPTGHLLYQRAGQLLAVSFDPERLRVTGVPVTVAEEVDYFPPSGTSYHTVSDDGTLLYFARSAAAPMNAVVAVDESGRATKLADAPFNPSSGSLSPDGRLLAVDPDGATQQIAIVDLARDTVQRITFEWDNASPLWTADGTRLIFRSNAGGGVRRLYWRPADGSGMAEAISPGSRDEIPTSVRGDWLLYEDVDPATRTDIWLMSLTDRKPRPFMKTPFDEGGARFSPDGRWVAYQSDQPGGWEVYVQPIGAHGARLQASQGGGIRPMWQPDGRSLTYIKENDVMRVDFSGGDRPQLGVPVRLFSLDKEDVLLDVMKDGRFVVLRRGPRGPATSVNVITNWFDEVRRRTEQ